MTAITASAVEELGDRLAPLGAVVAQIIGTVGGWLAVVLDWLWLLARVSVEQPILLAFIVVPAVLALGEYVVSRWRRGREPGGDSNI